MSWSIDVTGTKEGAAKRVAEQMDKLAATYAGKPEGADITAIKERLLAQIEAVDLSDDGYTQWNAVSVKANGSHAANPKGLINASFQAQVVRTSLAL